MALTIVLKQFHCTALHENTNYSFLHVISVVYLINIATSGTDFTLISFSSFLHNYFGMQRWEEFNMNSYSKGTSSTFSNRKGKKPLRNVKSAPEVVRTLTMHMAIYVALSPALSVR